MNEMFDRGGKFVGRDRIYTEIDHSQDLPAVEVLTAEHKAILAGAINGIAIGRKTIVDGL